MPGWKVHLTFNLIFIPFFWNLFLKETFFENIFLFLFLIFFYIIFSTLPDIDTKKSKIRNQTSLLFAGIITIFFISQSLNVISILSLPIGYLTFYFIFKNIPMKHRGFTHTFTCCFLLSFFVIFILNLFYPVGLNNSIYYIFLLFSGYFFHIFLDKTNIFRK